MTKKQLSQDDLALILIELYDTKSQKRRSAAKKIGKNQLAEFGDKLLTAYLKEREDSRTWETQTEMILALGKIKYTPALQIMKDIVDANKPEDMITHAAARSYVRIKSNHLNDAKPVIELLEFGNLSVLNGATSALVFDDVTLAEEDIKAIIGVFDGYNEEVLSVNGLSDPREYLLSCLCKGKDPTSTAYITRFLNSSSRALKACAELAMAGKKARYE